MAISSEDGLKRAARRFVPWLLVGLLLYWFGPAWVWHIRRTLDPFAFNDDARILIWPWLRRADPNLFPNDPFVAYYLAGLPEGFSALYRLVGALGWAKATSELLQYFSVLCVVICLSATARRIGGNVAAFLAAALVLGSESFFDRAGGGLPRAFAFPLVSAGLYALVTARPRILAALAIAGAAFYPVVSALLGLSLFFLLVLPSQWRRSASSPDAPEARSKGGVAASLRSRVVLLGTTLLCIVGLSVPMALRLRDYGAPITPAMLSAYPEAGAGGRLTREQHPPYESFPAVFVRHTRRALLGTGAPIAGRIAPFLRGTDQKENAVLTGILLLASFRVIRMGRRCIELRRLWILLLSAWIGHFMAALLAPNLFLPERYAQFGVPPLMVLLVAVGFGKFDATGRDQRDALKKPWLPAAAAAVLLGLVGGRGTSWIGIEVYVPPAERSMYEAIAQLPPDARIAGWPAGPLENIPYLSQRSVLTNFQLEMPFHTAFTLESRARLRALFAAYFSASPDPIARLCSEFDVTHFLIDRTQFEQAPPDYYEPHRADVARLYASSTTAEPFVQQLAKRTTAQRLAGGYTLLELSAVPELVAACSRKANQ